MKIWSLAHRYLLTFEAIFTITISAILVTLIRSTIIWDALSRLRYVLSSDLDLESQVHLWLQQQSTDYIGERVAVFAIQGRRPHMEDRFDVQKYSNSTIHYDLYGVYDGHGGDESANFIKANLLPTLVNKFHKQFESSHCNSTVPHTEIIDAFLTVDTDLLSLSREQRDFSGSTALVVLHSSNSLTVCNVGDCRAVLHTMDQHTIPLSTDHKPDLPGEKHRIEQAGGFVMWTAGVWRVSGVLATSRAFGDAPLKDDNVLTAEPEIHEATLDNPYFMILASDGLWDVFSNEEAAEFVRSHIGEEHFGAKALALQAFHRGSLDNITVMVVRLDKFPAQFRQPPNRCVADTDSDSYETKSFEDDRSDKPVVTEHTEL